LNNEIEKIKFTHNECKNKLIVDPDSQPLLSVQAQLEYILGLLDGSISDRSKLKDIIIGIYAVREFEDSDMEFANRLHEASALARAMKEGKR